MAMLNDLFPNADDLIALEPEELSGFVLEHFHSLSKERRSTELHASNLTRSYTVLFYPTDQQGAVADALMEAWSWLTREGLIVPSSETNFFKISRRGEALKTKTDVQEYRRRTMLPRGLLHQRLQAGAVRQFLLGKYDNAVFEAFKEVEVAVRDAAKFAIGEHGDEMIRKAFGAMQGKPGNQGQPGPLTDPSEPPGEQLALQHFVAGAYGRMRNPTAHRHGVVATPEVAFEMLMVASHLLRIAEERKLS